MSVNLCMLSEMPQSITTILPPEILGRIFSFLEQQDVSSCRLVCDAFHRISSPYLITTVVFARRLKTITRLKEIVAHPYFHKYVTELVYDASSYNEDVANDWQAYVDACEQEPRHLIDAEWAARKREDAKLWRGVRPYESQVEDYESYSAATDDRQYRDEEEYCDRVYGLGCHRSFPDYHRLYVAQRKIDSHGMPRRTLRDALEQLPQVRRVVFADWRSLARSGESFDDCAHRLFGNTLAPKLVDGTDFDSYDCFDDLLCAASQTLPRGRIESLAIEPHLFEDDEVSPSNDTDPGARGAQCIQNVFFEPEDDCVTDNVIELTKNLRRLRLSTKSTGEYSQSARCLPAVLIHGNNLTHLVLKDASKDQAYLNFVEDLRLPHLRHLDLQRWRMSRLVIQRLLTEHASTLRELRFLACLLDKDPVDLGIWAGKNLRLTGIELDRNPEVIKHTRTVPTRKTRQPPREISDRYLIYDHEHL